MDIKLTSYVEFEIVKTDANGASRVYRFNMPWGAPYPEAKEACGDAFNCLSEMEAQLKKKQEEVASELAPEVPAEQVEQLELIENKKEDENV